MCSATTATKVLRGVADVYTFGGYEALRAAKPTRSLVTGTESWVNKKVLGGSGQDATGAAPWDRTSSTNEKLSTPPPPDPIPTAAEPAPTPTPPTPSETAAMLRRKRLGSLRQGIASTILTGANGATDLPTLLSPVATGSGTTGKAKLGQ